MSSATTAAQNLPRTSVLLALDAAAAFVGLDPCLLRGVAFVESSFNPKVRNISGAAGLLQLMPGTARELGVTDCFDAAQNALGGATYLRAQLKRFGDVRLALAAYNWGPNNVATKHLTGGKPLPTSVEQYCRRVLERRDLERTSAPSSTSTAQCDLCGKAPDASKVTTTGPIGPPKGAA